MATSTIQKTENLKAIVNISWGSYSGDKEFSTPLQPFRLMRVRFGSSGAYTFLFYMNSVNDEYAAFAVGGGNIVQIHFISSTKINISAPAGYELRDLITMPNMEIGT